MCGRCPMRIRAPHSRRLLCASRSGSCPIGQFQMRQRFCKGHADMRLDGVVDLRNDVRRIDKPHLFPKRKHSRALEPASHVCAKGLPEPWVNEPALVFCEDRLEWHYQVRHERMKPRDL